MSNQATNNQGADPQALPSFSQFIATHENGELNNELTEQQRELNAALSNYVMNHGGKPEATMVVKIKFKLDGGMMSAQAEIDTKLPKEPRNSGFYFVDAANRLTKRDPKQLTMFQDVSGGARTPAVTI